MIGITTSVVLHDLVAALHHSASLIGMKHMSGERQSPLPVLTVVADVTA